MALDIDAITPIVLVGGRSRRFGRDKLREVVDATDNAWLVDRPIAALREVFGPRVMLVGDCDPALLTRADGVIVDAYPGQGPMGGILSALEASPACVFVLSGDLATITPGSIRRVLEGAEQRDEQTCCILASSGQVEPCIGLYLQSARPLFERALREGQRSLRQVLPAARVLQVPIAPGHAVNVNRPEDLPGST